MAGEVHELSEVLVRRVFINSKAWREYIALVGACDPSSHLDGSIVLPPESVIAELAETIKTYADAHSKESVRQIVRMAFNLEGYKECGLALWQLLYRINNIRVQMIALNPKDKQKSAAVLGEILRSMGIKLEEDLKYSISDGETDAKG